MRHFILLAWLALADYRATGTALAAAQGVLFTLALFASVVLHELGHAMAARRVGVPTRDITLLPIGDVARLESMPEKPRQELVGIFYCCRISPGGMTRALSVATPRVS